MKVETVKLQSLKIINKMKQSYLFRYRNIEKRLKLVLSNL